MKPTAAQRPPAFRLADQVVRTRPPEIGAALPQALQWAELVKTTAPLGGEPVADGDTISTSINGTDDEIIRHYLGHRF